MSASPLGAAQAPGAAVEPPEAGDVPRALPPYRVRGRHLAGWALLAALVSAAVCSALAAASPLSEALFIALFPLFLLLFLLRPLRRSGGSLAALLGRPTRRQALAALAAGVGLIGLAMPALAALYLPLYWLAPELASYVLLELHSPLLWGEGEQRWLANALGLVGIAVLAPASEELLFRGLLLPAWAARWGARRALVLSSLGFAALHVDPLGAFVFGAVAAAAYLATGALWVPILIHCTNNALAWAALVAEAAFSNGSPRELESELAALLWLAPLGLALGAPLVLAAWRLGFSRRESCAA